MYDNAIDQPHFPMHPLIDRWHTLLNVNIQALQNGLAGWQELAQRALSASRGSRPGTAGSGRSRPPLPFLDRLQIDLKERQRRLKV